MEAQISEHGLKYYPSLPENTRKGTINDFVSYGRKKVGMEYLVYSDIQNVYFVQVVREATTGKKIREYIDAEMLYVFTKTTTENAR